MIRYKIKRISRQEKMRRLRRLKAYKVADRIFRFSWKVCFFSTIVFTLFMAILVFTMSSEKTMSHLITKTVNFSDAPIKINRLDINEQLYRFPKAMVFKGVNAHIHFEDKEYNVSFSGLDLESFASLASKDQNILFKVSGFSIDSSDIEIANAKANLLVGIQNSKIKDVTGDIKMHKLIFDQLVFNNFQSNIIGDADEMNLANFSSSFYGGTIFGEMRYGYFDRNNYLIRGLFNNVNLERLTKDNGKLSSSLRGDVFGNIQLRGSRDYIGEFNISFSGLGGAEIKARLVKQLFGFFSKASPYLPQFEDLEGATTLLKKDGYMPFDRANVKVKSLDDKNMYGNLELESKQYQLDLDLTSDINVDGGISNFIDQVVEVGK